MPNMWRGPSAELRRAEANPLWAKLHRRNGRLGIFCNSTHDGFTASFYSISKQRGEWYQHDLGEVRGADPMLAVLHGSHTYTPADPELMQIHHAYLEHLAEEIVLDGRLIATKLAKAVDQFI